MAGHFKITFWGTRGSVPVMGAEFRKYGGNTSCVEVNCGERTIIFDAGTGIHPLSQKRRHLREVDLFFSHTHLDHIQGLPFFKPLYDRKATLRLWAGHLRKKKLQEVIGTLFTPSIFPLSLEEMAAKIVFKHFKAGKMFVLGDGIILRTMPLLHPGEATAYRLEYAGKSLCYVTDTEHEPGKLSARLVQFLKGADLFIYDSTFDDKEFSHYRGWGHSTWQQGARLAEKAGVKTFVAFHHNPGATDRALTAREKALKRLRPGSLLARDGLSVTLT
jgi:phosphoribosyl 1,2-cyclic phosphodiesterase